MLAQVSPGHKRTGSGWNSSVPDWTSLVLDWNSLHGLGLEQSSPGLEHWGIPDPASSVTLFEMILYDSCSFI